MPSAASKKSTPPARPPLDQHFTREVIRGVEMMSPLPARKHTRTASRLHGEIRGSRPCTTQAAQG